MYTHSMLRLEADGVFLMSDDEAVWVSTHKFILALRPIAPSSKLVLAIRTWLAPAAKFPPVEHLAVLRTGVTDPRGPGGTALLALVLVLVVGPVLGAAFAGVNFGTEDASPGGIEMVVRVMTASQSTHVIHPLYGAEWGHNRLVCCPECGPTGGSSCGSTFFTFLVYACLRLVTYLLGIIAIGGLLENYANVGSLSRFWGMCDVDAYLAAWRAVDPEGTGYCPTEEVISLLEALEPPLGLAGGGGGEGKPPAGMEPPPRHEQAYEHLATLGIPDHGGRAQFHEVLTAMAHATAGVPTVPVCDTTLRLAAAARRASAGAWSQAAGLQEPLL